LFILICVSFAVLSCICHMKTGKEQYCQFTDNDLLALLAKSDKQAFTEIYNRYWEKLFFVAGKKIIDLGEAESLVHDVLSDLWFRRETIEVRTELNHYLAISMKYRVIKLLAKHRKTASYVVEMEGQQVADTQTPETILGFEELKSKLAKLVSKLPAQCRIAYQLREKGFSQKEISHEMQIAEHTVERHLSRALKSLRMGLTQLLQSLLVALPICFALSLCL